MTNVPVCGERVTKKFGSRSEPPDGMHGRASTCGSFNRHRDEEAITEKGLYLLVAIGTTTLRVSLESDSGGGGRVSSVGVDADDRSRHIRSVGGHVTSGLGWRGRASWNVSCANGCGR